ncbi:hypothetical protein COU74_02070 [Candidatus Peregrinibacteria bacterium CG10_big_fil_rev_8_21_14_0_10_36_19]|nr:MAG: hypothetical protein COU74_02070 [Candidatus Peregrinibacteria bacterium CG10_big_fil_rev_8_21_14_0_10_36_19]
MHLKIKLHRPISGFAVSNAKAGEKVSVQTKLAITSQNPKFEHYARQIYDLIISKTEINSSNISKYLVLIHNDSNAEIYINDFEVTVKLTVKNDKEKGDALDTDDILKINEVSFPGIDILDTDTIIYFERINLQFLLFFDASAQQQGHHDNSYKETIASLVEQLHMRTLASAVQEKLNKSSKGNTLIITEGKTDIDHLKAAQDNLGIHDLNLEFIEANYDDGDESIFQLCRALAAVEQAQTFIFIFDSDNPSILKKLEIRTEVGKQYQIWGNNVYSLVIPLPDHRTDYDKISIEHYYTDEDLMTTDENGKRLHFHNELRKEILPDNTTKYRTIKPFVSLDKNKKVYSESAELVIDDEGNSVCISKARFAENVKNKIHPFDNLDFKQFQKIFDVIREIL